MGAKVNPRAKVALVYGTKRVSARDSALDHVMCTPRHASENDGAPSYLAWTSSCSWTFDDTHARCISVPAEALSPWEPPGRPWEAPGAGGPGLTAP